MEYEAKKFIVCTEKGKYMFDTRREAHAFWCANGEVTVRKRLFGLRDKAVAMLSKIRRSEGEE